MEIVIRHHLIKAGHHVALSVGLFFCAIFLIGTIVAVAYQLAYGTMIFPRVIVSGIEISNLTKDDAKKRLEIEFANNPNFVQVFYRGQVLTETTALSKNYDFGWAVEQAWGLGKSGNLLTKINERVNIFFRPRTIDLPINYDNDALDGMISKVVARINQEGVAAKIVVNSAGEIRIEPGSDGLVVGEEDLRKMIVAALIIPGNHNVEIPTNVESAAIDSARINEALAIANRWKGKTLRIFRNDYSYSLQTEAVFKLIGLTGEVVNTDEITRILSIIKPNLETEAKNAVFNIDRDKVVEFSAEMAGVKIDESKFREKLISVVMSSEPSELEIPIIVTEPKIRAGDINNLGIKTLIGVGTSKFHNSIPNRIHNLTLASARLNGAIIPPGETFSLGEQIGDVSRATGYREAYVISQGRTVLGDGGGVCQVSTTMFRAALNVGLPIVERKAHSYRVHYYEEDLGPGFDATVFLPNADLKFVNDTPGHILVQTKVDTKTFSMRYEIYGTNDGRVATVSAAKTYSQSAPLPTIYQDDPTLPSGTKKQVDWSAWGAKVSFDYKVTRGDEILQDRTFFSTYQPWAAVYLVGTGGSVSSR
jgi:vancomycin resistance protein YoaR